MILLAAIGAWSMGDLAILVVIAAVLIGIVVIVMHESGIALPPYVWKIAGLVLLAIIAILAIKFVVSL